MKQHLEVKDLEQLTELGKERLLKYMDDKNYMPHGVQMMLHNHGYYLAQFLSIGQMIEFLWKHNYQPADYEMLTFDDSTEFICDELWSACVEILNKE